MCHELGFFLVPGPGFAAQFSHLGTAEAGLGRLAVRLTWHKSSRLPVLKT